VFRLPAAVDSNNNSIKIAKAMNKQWSLTNSFIAKYIFCDWLFLNGLKSRDSDYIIFKWSGCVGWTEKKEFVFTLSTKQPGSISSTNVCGFFMQTEWAQCLTNSKYIWQKKCTNCNLSLKLEVLIVGKMEQQIFHVPVTFCLSKKVWWNQRISCCFQKNHHI
jgi:hypothetical protein